MNALDEQKKVSIDYICGGRKPLGLILLLDYIKNRPNDLCAWLWLSSIAKTDQDRRTCLHKILEIAPDNQEARRGLTYLSLSSEDRNTKTLEPSQQVSPIFPKKKRRRQKRKYGVSGKKNSGRLSYLTSAACVLGTLFLFYFKFIASASESPQNSVVHTNSDHPAISKVAMSGQLNIVPVSMVLSPPSGGWQPVQIKLAYENRSKFFRKLIIPSGSGTMITEEGYRYPSVIRRKVKGMLSNGRLPLWLPPGFRFGRIYSHDLKSAFEAYYEIQMRVAEQSHPIKLSFPGFSDIDLRGIPEPNRPFPLVNAETMVYTAGHVIELPEERIRLKVERIDREKLQFDPKGAVSDLFVVSVTQENLDQGYEKKIFFTTIAISENGVLGSLSQEVIEKIEQCPPLPTLGPNQKAMVTGCTVMPEGENGVKIILAIKTGHSHEFVVIDSGY